MSSRSTRVTAALIAVTAGAGVLAAAPLLADGHNHQPPPAPAAGQQGQQGPQRQQGPAPAGNQTAPGARVSISPTQQPGDDRAPGAQGGQGGRDNWGQGRGRQFRVNCDFAKSGMFDPIVFPGQDMAGHQHQFFGNTSITGQSTTASLVAANVNGTATTCDRTTDGSAYWVPALMQDGTEVTPDEAELTYRAPRGQRRTRAFPAGFTMIAGDKTATTLQAHAGWRCEFSAPGTALSASVPTCAADEDIVSVVTFPNCWDGTNLTSKDQSHVVYATKGAACPADHAIALPELRMETYWPSAGAGHTYTLGAMGMDTAGIHADFMNGWNQNALRRAVRHWNHR
jgi:hypothetical protein